MDDATLTHHTELTDWCTHKQMQQDHRAQHLLHQHSSSPLPPDKLLSVDQWCSEVNRILHGGRKKDPPPLFRRCKYSDSMFPPNRSSTVSPSSRKQSSTSMVRSTVLSGQTTVTPKPPFEDNGVAKKNLTLRAKTANTTDSEVLDQKVVHINVLPNRPNQSSTGWTTNRHMLFPTFPHSLFHKLPVERMLGENNEQTVALSKSSVCYNISTADSQNLDTPSSGSLHELRHLGDSNDEDGNTTDMNGVNGETSRCEQFYKNQDFCETQNAKENAIRPVKPKPNISDRSASNDILKVLTVDDCKMMLRYRPVRVVNTHNSIIPPCSQPPFQQYHDKDGDLDDTNNGDAVTHHNSPICHTWTTPDPSKIPSQLNTHSEMQRQLLRRMPHSSAPCRLSPTIERAFRVLLDDNFQTCPTPTRPISRLSCHQPSRPSSNISCYNSSAKLTSSSRFKHLNSTLRKHVTDKIDSQSHDTKPDGIRSRNGCDETVLPKAQKTTNV